MASSKLLGLGCLKAVNTFQGRLSCPLKDLSLPWFYIPFNSQVRGTYSQRIYFLFGVVSTVERIQILRKPVPVSKFQFGSKMLYANSTSVIHFKKGTARYMGTVSFQDPKQLISISEYWILY